MSSEVCDDNYSNLPRLPSEKRIGSNRQLKRNLRIVAHTHEIILEKQAVQEQEIKQRSLEQAVIEDVIPGTI